MIINKRIPLFFLLVVSNCMTVKAVSVLWDAVIDDYYAPLEGQLEITCFRDGNFMLDAVLVPTIMPSSEIMINMVSQCLGASQNLIVAQPGDVASHVSTRNLSKDAYFVHSFIDDEDYYGTGSVSASLDSSVYMMFVFSDDMVHPHDPSYIYGWVEIAVSADGTLSLGRSAIDLDGGPMIVGGGAWEGATPEPASGVLLLIGGALLALRRNAERRRHAR